MNCFECKTCNIAYKVNVLFDTAVIFVKFKQKKKRTFALFMEQMLNFIATKRAVTPIVLLIWGCSDDRNNKGLYHVRNPYYPQRGYRQCVNQEHGHQGEPYIT